MFCTPPWMMCGEREGKEEGGRERWEGKKDREEEKERESRER